MVASKSIFGAWSPDGTRIVSKPRPRHGDGTLQVTKTDGTARGGSSTHPCGRLLGLGDQAMKRASRALYPCSLLGLGTDAGQPSASRRRSAASAASLPTAGSCSRTARIPAAARSTPPTPTARRSTRSPVPGTRSWATGPRTGEDRLCHHHQRRPGDLDRPRRRNRSPSADPDDPNSDDLGRGSRQRRVDPVLQLPGLRLRRRDLRGPAQRHRAAPRHPEQPSLLQPRGPGARRCADGLHALARRRREDGDLRLIGRGRAPAAHHPPRLRAGGRTGHRPGAGSRSPARCSATGRHPGCSRSARTAPASPRSRTRPSRTPTRSRPTRRTAGRSCSRRTAATTTSAAPTCSSWTPQAGRSSVSTSPSMPPTHGGEQRPPNLRRRQARPCASARGPVARRAPALPH